MRIDIPPKHAYHLINHGPCNLITTGDDKSRNVAPINWTMPLNTSPALMVAVLEVGIYTQKLVESTNQFVINVMGEAMAEKVLACGRCHGSDVDKFAKFGLTALAAKNVRAPYLKESLAHIECSVVNRHAYDTVVLYAGEVLSAQVEEELWSGKSLIIEKAKTLHHLTGGTFAITERTIQVSR